MASATNSAGRNPKLFCKSSNAKRALSYFADHFFGQNSATVFFSLPSSRIAPKSRFFGLSVFAPHIRHVVCVGSNKKMLGVYATGVVAAVTNEHSVWNGDAGDDQGRAMRADVCTALSANADSPVPVNVAVRGPRPALIRALAVNFSPKTYFKRLRHSLKIVGKQLQCQGSVHHL